MTTNRLRSEDTMRRQSKVSPTAFRIAAIAIGLVVMGLLIVQGALVDSPALSVLAGTTTLALIMLIVLGASAPAMTSGRRTLLHTLVPLTGGMVVIAIVVGRGRFLGQMSWWLPAALISVVPIFIVAALPLSRLRVDRPRDDDRTH